VRRSKTIVIQENFWIKLKNNEAEGALKGYCQVFIPSARLRSYSDRHFHVIPGVWMWVWMGTNTGWWPVRWAMLNPYSFK